MRFFTEEECGQWLAGRGRQLPHLQEELLQWRCPFPEKAYRIYSYARWIASSILDQGQVLLWVTESGIWKSSENGHLYYRLRQSYSDHRLLYEAPGHLFLPHETEDLITFLQISILNGWGGYVLDEMGRVSVFFSHDEVFLFYAREASDIEEIRAWVDEAR